MADTKTTKVGLPKCEGDPCDSPHLRTWHCVYCDSSYCDACWGRQGPHKPGKFGPDGLRHEKSDMQVVRRLRAILDPTDSQEELTALHEEDEDSKWFGIIRQKSPDGKDFPKFHDYGRYSNLMADNCPENGRVRYPQFVSFVGQTNAGKSTLVKMLVSHGELKLKSTHAREFPSPVVGSPKNDRLPTSGDVHLYADPASYHGELPMLFADCEGLDGGNELPFGAKSRKRGNSDTRRRIKNKMFHGAPRNLAWATSSETSGREFAVKHLYPRLLYTFSDVIVFVLRNPKTFESIALKLLLDWAAGSLEKSLNQPTLPHAIIALNATPLGVDDEEWDVTKATKNLMAQYANAINTVPEFSRTTRAWREKGKKIANISELMQCYYSSITVVRIPMNGRYMLIDEQVGKLHEEIEKGCNEAFYTKQRARMLSNADELNVYLQAGFDHFTTKLDAPFNFMDVSLKNNPIPQDFGDHILTLAVAIQTNRTFENTLHIFEKLSFMVASCVLLDCVRQRRKGTVEELFDKYYVNVCKAALNQFLDRYWPCSFHDRRGRACQNVKSRHSPKGHQNEKGKIIGAGNYKSSSASDKFSGTWILLIRDNLGKVVKQLNEKRRQKIPGRADVSEIQEAHYFHQQHMDYFFQQLVSARKYTSLSTCFCCLMQIPQHPLPCGHVLCAGCIKAYGIPYRGSSILMEKCPLHSDETEEMEPWLVRFKPDFAGIRILSLDGGGIRGIIELQVLKEIERIIGKTNPIPIQAFFDLIVGTSTGGIIALGLGVRQWSTDACIEKFTSLCDKAFTPRVFHGITGMQQATTLKHGSLYKTKPLKTALDLALGNEHLFGGPHESYHTYTTKVAVTSTTETGQQPVVLANYNRQDNVGTSYKFEFSDGPNPGLTAWEAACATSAAPKYFKPFQSDRSGRSYLDGALYYNNPVRVANHERKLLWPDVADKHPDILLSIGTGQNLQAVNVQMETGEFGPKMAQNRNPIQVAVEPNPARRRKYFRTWGRVKQAFNVLVHRMDSILDAEIAWNDFQEDVADPQRASKDNHRYIRINPDLKRDPPPLDAKKELQNIKLAVINELRTPKNVAKINRIVQRLVASAFYFEKATPERNDDNTYLCWGALCCRFETHSTEIRALGDFLRLQQTPEFQPHFLAGDTYQESEERKMNIDPDTIAKMISHGEFKIDDFRFSISSKLAPTNIALSLLINGDIQPRAYPISGFPRTLVIEDELNERRAAQLKSLSRHHSDTNVTNTIKPGRVKVMPTATLQQSTIESVNSTSPNLNLETSPAKPDENQNESELVISDDKLTEEELTVLEKETPKITENLSALAMSDNASDSFSDDESSGVQVSTEK